MVISLIIIITIIIIIIIIIIIMIIIMMMMIIIITIIITTIIIIIIIIIIITTITIIITDLESLIKSYDIWVPEAGHDLCFPVQVCPDIFVLDLSRVYDFYGHLRVEQVIN